MLDVLSAKPSVIIHEHDENSWQRLFTVLSHNKKKLKSHQLLSLLYYLLQSDSEKIMSQVVLYNNYIVLYYLTWFARFVFSRIVVLLWFCNVNFRSIREKTKLAIHVK